MLINHTDKLPNFTIEKFSGIISMWRDFYEMAIHKNDALKVCIPEILSHCYHNKNSGRADVD